MIFIHLQHCNVEDTRSGGIETSFSFQLQYGARWPIGGLDILHHSSTVLAIKDTFSATRFGVANKGICFLFLTSTFIFRIRISVGLAKKDLAYFLLALARHGFYYVVHTHDFFFNGWGSRYDQLQDEKMREISLQETKRKWKKVKEIYGWASTQLD